LGEVSGFLHGQATAGRGRFARRKPLDRPSLLDVREPQEVFATIEKLSDLEIETDDNVDMLLTYPGSLRVCLHLDLYGRPHEKSTTLLAKGAPSGGRAIPNQIAIGQGMAGWERIEPFTCERNEMFIAVAREFLQVLQGSPASCTLADGVAVLRIVRLHAAAVPREKSADE